MPICETTESASPAPQAGERLFDDLGCAECHSLLPGDADLVPLADTPHKRRTLPALAVEMWNHRPHDQ